ncbi:MAG: hypothetical protein KAQ98_01205 [Bacteriovoracaceae bacterium]|nr:hypothetical protein [Bacteriovoracaceae bacterium]
MNKFRKAMIIGLCAVPMLTTAVLGTENEDVDVSFNMTGKVSTRALHLPKTDGTNLQSHLTLKMVLDVDGSFQVIGIARSGETFAGNWDTFEDMDSPNDEFDPTLNVRNVYIQQRMEDHTLQIGAIPIENGLFQSAGLSGTGWIDGGRLKLKTQHGDVIVSAGSVSDIEEADAFRRDFDFNYLEVKVSRKFFENVCVEAAVEQHDDTSFLKGAVTYDVAIASDRMVKFLGEVIKDDEDGFKALGGVEADIVEVLTGDKSGIKVNVSYQYMSEEFDNTRSATSFWTQPGSTVMVRASGPLSSELGLSWFTQMRINEESDRSYYIVGVSKALDFNEYYDYAKEKLIDRE